MEGYNKECVIVGGGISGLVSAYELAKRGYKVTILEKNDHVGGRLYQFVKGKFKADGGAQFITENYFYTLRLLKELGLLNELVEIHEPSTAIYSDGNFFLLSQIDMIKYPKLNFYEKVKLYKLIREVNNIGNRVGLDFINIKKGEIYDSYSISQWTIENYGESIYENFVQPSLTATTLTDSDELSALYGILLLYNDLKKAYVLKNGLATLTTTLYTKLQNFHVSIQTKCNVRKINHVGNEFEVEYEYNNTLSRIEAPNVVCSLPTTTTLKIATSLLNKRVKSSLSKVKYSFGIQILLGLATPIWNKTWSIIIPRNELKGFASICESTIKCKSFAPKGNGLLEVFLYGKTAEAISKLTKTEIIDFLIDRLELLFPGIDEKVMWYEILKWDKVIPIPIQGYLELEFSVPIERFALAGDYLYLPSIEAAVYSGICAARKIIKA